MGQVQHMYSILYLDMLLGPSERAHGVMVKISGSPIDGTIAFRLSAVEPFRQKNLPIFFRYR